MFIKDWVLIHSLHIPPSPNTKRTSGKKQFLSHHLVWIYIAKIKATQKREKRRFYGNQHTKHPRIESEGEGESVTQKNNTESEVSSSVDEGNAVTFPSGISAYYKKLQSRAQQHSSVEEPPKASNESSQGNSGFKVFQEVLSCQC